jgi:hypothetical protein
MREQHAFGTPAAQETTADHEPYELRVVIALGRLVIAIVLTFRFVSFAQEVGQHHAPRAAAAEQAAADEQARQVYAFLVRVFARSFFAFVEIVIGFQPLAEQPRESGATQPLAAYPASQRNFPDVLVFNRSITHSNPL